MIRCYVPLLNSGMVIYTAICTVLSSVRCAKDFITSMLTFLRLEKLFNVDFSHVFCLFLVELPQINSSVLLLT